MLSPDLEDGFRANRATPYQGAQWGAPMQPVGHPWLGDQREPPTRAPAIAPPLVVSQYNLVDEKRSGGERWTITSSAKRRNGSHKRGIADRGKTPGASRILVARYAKGRAPARAKKGPKKSEDSGRRPAT